MGATWSRLVGGGVQRRCSQPTPSLHTARKPAHPQRRHLQCPTLPLPAWLQVAASYGLSLSDLLDLNPELTVDANLTGDEVLIVPCEGAWLWRPRLPLRGSLCWLACCATCSTCKMQAAAS